MKYSFSDLKEDLKMGMEIEFYYNKSRYAISNNERGWFLSKYGDDNYQMFQDVDELLRYATVDCKTLKEIWNDTYF